MDDIRTPSLSQVLDRAIQQALKETYVSCPATILDYDSTTQTATVQPCIEKYKTAIDGTISADPQPAINKVPILFPGGGGFRIMWPLKSGDTVTLITLDQSSDIWKIAGGNSVDPLDERIHSINDAVAIPALRPTQSAWNPDDSTVITIGIDGGTADFVATAQRVLAQLSAIKSAFDSHTHAGVTAGGGISGTPSIPMPSPSAPASSSVKILG